MEQIYDLQREHNERRNGMEKIIVKKAENCKGLGTCEENKYTKIMLSNSRTFWEKAEKIIDKFL